MRNDMARFKEMITPIPAGMHSTVGKKTKEEMFRPGTVLWRDDVIFTDDSVIMSTSSPFTRTEKGSFMAKLVLNGQWMYEPGIISHAKLGIVVFVNDVDQIPPYWTHLLVQRTMLKEGDKGCIFAEIPTPYSLQDYANFRMRMAISHKVDLPHAQRFDIAKKIQTSECRLDELRLISTSLAIGGYGYNHLRLLESNNGTMETELHSELPFGPED